MFQFFYKILLKVSPIPWTTESVRRDLRSECLLKCEVLDNFLIVFKSVKLCGTNLFTPSNTNFH